MYGDIFILFIDIKVINLREISYGMTLIKSISGIRGTIGGAAGDNLTPLDLVKFTSAYAEWLKGEHPGRRLKVVIDLHHPPMPGVRADDTEMWEHPDLEKNFTAFWRAVATRLKPYGDVIWGYDLLNEPLDRNQLPHAPREWRPLAVKILKAIREIDPDVWIIYEPGPGGGTAGLRNLRPLPDYKVIYSTHFYDPGAFTHQGIHNIAGTDRLKVEEKINVRYPGVIDGVYYDKGKLAESLKIIDDFQARYPVPWFIGEFSVVRWAPAGSGEQFLRDALELFEERKWSWTYHAFREHHCWSLEHDGQFWREGMPSPKPVGDTPRGQVVRNFLTK